MSTLRYSKLAERSTVCTQFYRLHRRWRIPSIQNVQNVSERVKVNVSEQQQPVCSSARYEPTSHCTLIYSRLSETANLDVRHFDLSWLPVWINSFRTFATVSNEAGRHQVPDLSESSTLLRLHTSLSAQSRPLSVDCTRAATRGRAGSILYYSWINFHGATTGTTRGWSEGSAKETRINWVQ